jgi:hypothetical protein
MVIAPQAPDDARARAAARWWGPVAERMTRAMLEDGPAFLAEVVGGVQAGFREADAERSEADPEFPEADIGNGGPGTHR